MDFYSNNKSYKEKYPFFLLLLLAMAASNFLVLGVYIFLIVALCFLFFRTKFVLPPSALPLLLFAGFYFAFTALYPDKSLITSLKIFVCPLLWIVGYNMALGKKIEQHFIVIIFLAFGMTFHGIANYIYNILNDTDFALGRTYDVFTKELSSSTGQAINFTLFIALAFWLIFLQKNKLLKITSIALYICSVLYDIQIGGRTFLVLSAIAIIVGLVGYIVFSAQKTGSKKRIVLLVLLVLGVVVLLLLAFCFDLFGIKTFYEKSYLYTRLENHGASELGHDTRFSVKLKYLKKMPYYLFGGNHLSQENNLPFAHELWLDIYDDAGIFAYLAIVIYSILAAVRSIKTICLPILTLEQKTAVFCLSIILFLQFFVEPILSGAPMLLYSFIIIDGMLAAHLYENQKNTPGVVA